jgi:hypothetical protein
MTSIDIKTLLTITFVHVHDWYQERGQKLLKGKAGRKATFSDSEVMTLMIVTRPRSAMRKQLCPYQVISKV